MGDVLTEYGSKCAVCNIKIKELIHAAHICGIEDGGTDDWRNGLPLCGTHHLAFDQNLFCFSLMDLKIITKKGISLSSISVTETILKTKKYINPHNESIEWKFNLVHKS